MKKDLDRKKALLKREDEKILCNLDKLTKQDYRSHFSYRLKVTFNNVLKYL